MSACTGGSPSAQTPSSSAREQLGEVRLAHEVVALVIEGRVEEEAVVLDAEVLVGSRMPPLRRVMSCSPSASARTVTAHSLNAIGIR